MIKVINMSYNDLCLYLKDCPLNRNTDLKQYWMPDSVSKECYDCCEKFTTFRRRHHCRVCGQIFCSKCCYQEIPGKIMGCSGNFVTTNVLIFFFIKYQIIYF